MLKIFSLMNLLVAKNNLKKCNSSNNSGFSLLEITVVIMIIGTILSLALSRTNFNKPDNRKVFRDMVMMVKEIRNRAKLYGTTYRIAFRLDEKNQAYWVEKSTSPTLLSKDQIQIERDESQKNMQDDDPEKYKSPFQIDTTYTKNEKTLPEGFSFKSIESGPQEVIFTDGVAYIHFFPQGMIEPIALHIVDPKKNIWTLVFNSITGQADIIDGEKSLKDLNH